MHNAFMVYIVFTYHSIYSFVVFNFLGARKNWKKEDSIFFWKFFYIYFIKYISFVSFVVVLTVSVFCFLINFLCCSVAARVKLRIRSVLIELIRY